MLRLRNAPSATHPRPPSPRLLPALAALAAAVVTAPLAAADWPTIKGDVYNAGKYTSSCFGVYGWLFVAHYKTNTADLYLTDRRGPDSDEFSFTGTVDTTGSVGTYTGMVCDSDDRLHICYFDATNLNLKYYSYIPGVEFSEITEIVASAGDVGRYASIALDSLERPHIAYYDATNGDLKHAVRVGDDDWDRETVAAAGTVGQYTSILIGSGDSVHIAYYDATNADLKYAKYAGGAWSNTTVDSAGSVGKFAAIGAYGSIVYIAYYDETNRDLKLATKGAAWTREIADAGGTVGQYASMAIGLEWVAGGGGLLGGGSFRPVVHIAYYDAGATKLKYAKKAGGVWSREFPDSSAGCGTYTSIALGDGGVNISYYDSNAYGASGTGRLKFARNN